MDDHELFIDGKELFTYVLSTCWKDLSKGWNADTQDGYIFYYNQITPYFLKKPLDEYDQDDVDEIIDEIQSEKEKRSGKKYKDGTLQKIMYLIRIVVRFAKETGIITEDFLWGSRYQFRKAETENDIKKELVLLKKSFSIEEEIRIGEKVLGDPMQAGQSVGLALMFALGLRNGEACGLTYRAIREMADHSGNFVIRIYQTTIRESNDLKEGGKTSNAPRKLPLPNKLHGLLAQRKCAIQAKIDSGEIVLPESIGSIEDLPIACKGNDYTVFCSSRDLRKAGKALFEEVKVDENELAFIDRAMNNKNVLAEMGLQEKDPTVYLFRRNLGTHLRILGMSQTEIEAFMGHSILDSRAERNDFENEDIVFAIKDKLEQRPIVGTTPLKKYMLDGRQVEKISPTGAPAEIELTLAQGECAQLDITAIEPGQKLSIEVCTSKQVKKLPIVKGHFYHEKFVPEAAVNVIGDYQRGYAAMSQHKK